MIPGNRRPVVSPPLQVAAQGQTPVHNDPTVRITGRQFQPVSHRGELYVQPMTVPYRPSVLDHPNIQMAPPPRIGDQTGEHAALPQSLADAQEGMPASSWELRRNYRPTAAIEAGESEV